MRPDFRSKQAVVVQLQETEKTIKHFLDEVNGDDLQRYPNLEAHLPELIHSISRSNDALVSLEAINVQVLPNMTQLTELISSAIGIIKKREKIESTGTLAAAFAALSLLQNSIGELKQEGPSETNPQKVEKTDTDSRTR